METKLDGHKCLLCGDIIYKRTRWDSEPHCRCGNISFSDYDKFVCIVENKSKKVEVELGNGIDKNILERDENQIGGEYGRVESEITEDELEKMKTKVLLLEK